MSTVTIDASTRKLIGTPPEKLMTDDHESDRKLLPPMINNHKDT